MPSSKASDVKKTTEKDGVGKMLRDAGRQQPEPPLGDLRMRAPHIPSSGKNVKRGKKRQRKEDSTLPHDSSLDKLPPAKRFKTTNPVIPFQEPAIAAEASTLPQVSGLNKLPPANRIKTPNPVMPIEAPTIPAEGDDVSTDQLSQQKHQNESSSLIAPELQIQLAAYLVVDINIISSSQIHMKVTQILEAVERFSFVAALKPTIVFVHAKGPVVSKMITIVEIAKREINKQAKWFQYNGLEKLMAKNERKDKSSTANGPGRRLGTSTEMEIDQDGGDEDGDDTAGAFETMKTAWERALEGTPKVKAVPVLTTFLSRIRVPILKEKYGEQTNALT